MSEEKKEETKKEKPAWGSVHINDQNRRRKTDALPVSKTMKRLWKAHLAENKKSRASLKQFARSQNDALAKDWFNHKRGSLDKAAKKHRTEARGGTIRATAQASKAARKGKPGGGK